MCGIAGFVKPGYGFLEEQRQWEAVLMAMNRAQKHRGPDDEGVFLAVGCGLAQVRLSAIDGVMGHQPIVRRLNGNTCAIACDGEIYNMRALKAALKAEGTAFDTAGGAEVILLGYMRYRIDYIKEVNGVFSIAIWDEGNETLYLIRDRLGVKPLFYTALDGVTVIASEIKGLFAYPGIFPVIDRDGLCEIFGLGPAKTYGKGVFKDIWEVLPGHCCAIGKSGRQEHAYWQLQSHEHTESYADTVQHTSELLQDAIKGQTLSDTPVCTFLSGGLDSSLVTAICADELNKQGKELRTFSFDFVDNSTYFQASAFQPSLDRPYVEQMVEYLGTEHTYLTCDNAQLIDYLDLAVEARDLPGMADVDASLLYFCSEVAKSNRVALTGECADEQECGYPEVYADVMERQTTWGKRIK